MPQRNLEDDLNEAFKKFQQEARERATAEGKKEVTQEDYDQIPVVRLNKSYDNWKPPVPNWKIKELYNATLQNLSGVPYSLSDVERFDEVNRNNSLEYTLFMCAVGSALKQRRGVTTRNGYLYPYIESANILPQLFYLVDRSSAAKVILGELGTVVLIECEKADLQYLDMPQNARLVIDCELKGSYRADVGHGMKSGILVLTQKTEPTDLGRYMTGGTLVYEGDLVNVDIGQEMSGGTIVVNGNVSGKSNIGWRLKGNSSIRIKGNYSPNEESHWGIGQEMHGGSISIEKEVTGRIDIGSWMESGTIRISGNVYEARHVGYSMKNDAIIQVHSNCMAGEIGSHMENGTIMIGKDGGNEIGLCMKNGRIHIAGNATSKDHRIGDMMDGGKIIIDGNAGVVSNLMYGGEIRINGMFRGEYVYGGLGKVYERGKLIHPGLMARITGKLERSSIRR